MVMTNKNYNPFPLYDPNKYYDDYEKEPIGGGNPYYRCYYCKLSAPQINGRVEGHLPSCDWRQYMEFPGPDACDGPDEEGFHGPRPWNGFKDE